MLATWFCSPRAEAQQHRSIHGRIISRSNAAPIADARVKLLDGSTVASTSASGSFALRIPDGAVQLLAVRLGFRPETLTVAADQDTVIIRLQPSAFTLDPITVSAEPAYSAASSRTVREFDINLRPRETSQELLRLAPGLVIAQHAGGGKAEQIFLRGFDADHGTDVAISVDGTPVNMVSHGHGQGYADLHFLIPEVVEVGDVRKGPYDAQDGDLATAGAVNFRTKDRVGHPLAGARGGSFSTVHGVGLLPFGGDAAHAGGYLAATAHYTDGPVVRPQDYQRLNGFAKFTAPVGHGVQLVASASGFDSRWNASGQIPERAVRQGLIPRFGSLDPSEGGNTSRYDLSAGLRSTVGGDRTWNVRAYAVRYSFELFSNFTLFANDSANGDGIRQTDHRSMVGLQSNFTTPSRFFSLTGRTGLGAGGRADLTDVGLHRAVRRIVLGTRVDATVRQQNAYGWVKQDLDLSRKVRLQIGLRGDLFRFKVDDHLVDTASDLDHVSGARTKGILSPKASLAIQVTPATSVYVNAGAGFHSNDARQVIQSPAQSQVLPRAIGTEVGVRHGWNGGTVAAGLWALDLESELVYVGDEGTTEANGRTRRVGIDLEGRVRLAGWLWADADFNLSRGRMRDEPDGGDLIPLAPTVTSTGGLTVRDLGAVEGGIRYRHIGGRAADETNTVRAKGYTVVELFTTWRLGRLQTVFTVDNLFDVEWNEAQFATTSRLADEPAPVTELHFTPGAWRGVQFGVQYVF